LNDECAIKKEKFLQWNDHFIKKIISKIVIKHLGLHGPLAYVLDNCDALKFQII
jgi:hypothetical protein